MCTKQKDKGIIQHLSEHLNAVLTYEMYNTTEYDVYYIFLFYFRIYNILDNHKHVSIDVIMNVRIPIQCQNFSGAINKKGL